MSHLLDAFRWARDGVLEAVVFVDGHPQVGEGAVLLQGVGAFGSEVIVHGRVPHRPVRQVHLLGQVLEGPGEAAPARRRSLASLRPYFGFAPSPIYVFNWHCRVLVSSGVNLEPACC